jgi:hypothetical protein
MLSSFENFSGKASEMSREGSLEKKQQDMSILKSELLKAIKGTEFRIILLTESENKVMADFAEFIENKDREALRKIEASRAAFTNGSYDVFLSTNLPEKELQLQELKSILDKYPRIFTEKLFLLCKSSEVFKFWLKDVGMELPKDAAFLAVALGNNLVVLQHLKEEGILDVLSNDEKALLLEKAGRFKNKGLEFLQHNVTYDPSMKWRLK